MKLFHFIPRNPIPHNAVVLVTYKDIPKLTTSDQLLFKPLKQAGFSPYPIPWDKKGVDWTRFRAVILRSCWDYHLRLTKFLDWVDQLEQKKVILWNPASIIRWNWDKHYLQSLQQQGIPTVPTLWFNQGLTVNVEHVLEEQDWQSLVIKPTVGLSGYEVHVLDKIHVNDAQKKVNQLLKKQNIMIQPLMKEVQEEGEWSLIFIGKKYSHAVLKRPRLGEFRANYQLGRTVTIIEPNSSIIKQAEKIIHSIDLPLLYARVDGLDVDGIFTLMELELIEPNLFFDYYPNATAVFAKEVKEFLA